MNDISKHEVLAAIDYLHRDGFVQDMTSDKGYYTETLIKYAAFAFNIDLK